MRLYLAMIWAIPMLDALDRWLGKFTKPLDPYGAFEIGHWIQRLEGKCGGRGSNHTEHQCTVWIIRIPLARFWKISQANYAIEREYCWHSLYLMHASQHGWSAIHVPADARTG